MIGMSEAGSVDIDASSIKTMGKSRIWRAEQAEDTMVVQICEGGSGQKVRRIDSVSEI